MLYLSDSLLDEHISRRQAHLKANSVLDKLWRMKVMVDMGMVIASFQDKLDKHTKKNPNSDIGEQQLIIRYLEELEKWMSLVWDEALQLDLQNLYLTELLLRKELQIRERDDKIKELEQEITNLKENIE